MREKIHRSGFIDTRIAWVRIQGSIFPIFYIVVCIPRKYCQETSFAHEIITQLHTLVQSIPKTDCIIICGDFNYQLRHNIQGLTGNWSMTKRNEDNRHYRLVINLMRDHNLFAVNTRFKSSLKQWNGKK